MSPDKDHTCPFSESCKLHLSPGDIIRYAISIALSVFLMLFIFSLFFPHIIAYPDLKVLRELVEIFHHAISGVPSGS